MAAPHPSGTAPTLAPSPVTTATCGQGGSDWSRHCRGSARVPEASAPHLVRGLHRVPTPLPGPRLGPGRGAGAGSGVFVPAARAQRRRQRIRAPLPAPLAPRTQLEPAALEDRVGWGSRREKGSPAQRPGRWRTGSAQGREEGPLRPPAPDRCGSRLRADLERLSRAPAPAARSPQRYTCSCVAARTFTHSPGPTRSRRGQPGTHRAARTHSFWCRTLRTHPARHWIPRPAARAAPPTFPDSGDAGSALRVALRGGGRPDQLQQQPQREPGPSQRAGNAGSRGAEGGASGRRRCHPRSGATAESSQTEPAPERELKPVRGGGVKRLTPPRPSPAPRL